MIRSRQRGWLAIAMVVAIVTVSAAGVRGAEEQQLPHGLKAVRDDNSAAKIAAMRSPINGAPIGTGAGHTLTFNHDIAPIVFQYCGSCHRPGEAGPFPLLTYDDVKKHARQIVAVTQTRFMPPWLPEPQALKFADERRLSDEQIATIRKWVDEGMLQGNPADLPPQPQFVAGWQLGKPDLIVKAAKPFLLPATGIDTYWNFILPIPIEQTRWAKAVEIRPGDKRLVHHANILVDRLELSRKLEEWKSELNRSFSILTATSSSGSRAPYRTRSRTAWPFVSIRAPTWC